MINTLQNEYTGKIKAPHTDALTGLFTHGFFLYALERYIDEARQGKGPFVLALIDINHFSEYNRRHGPLEGDRILKEVAGLIRDKAGPGELIARFSPDKFTILFRDHPLQQHELLIEAIQDGAGELSGGEISLSAGIVPATGSGGLAGLLEKAEIALGRAKADSITHRHVYTDRVTPPKTEAPKVLVVDDEESNVKLLEALLLPLDYEVIKAYNGEDALSIAASMDIDLVLLDVMMPGLNGYEVCRRLKKNEATRTIPVVMVTALDDIDAKIIAIEAGADDFLTKPPNRMELTARTKSLIRVKRMNNNLISIENVLYSLANVIEAKDKYTEHHIQRVSGNAMALGRRLGLPESDIEALKISGILHDIGKVGIPHEILGKPGPLTPEERKVIETHSVIGYNICLPLKKTLGPALTAIRWHHEKMNGSGYPDGLSGDEIPLVARILTVVDIYDSLITDRPYRQALDKKKSLQFLKEEAANGRLDSTVVASLEEMLSERS